MSTELDTTPETDTAATEENTTPPMWAEHRELIQLSGYVVKSVLQTMTQNPMVSASLGPEFVVEATAVANRLGELLAIVNPDYSENPEG